MSGQKQAVVNAILSVIKERTGQDYEMNGEVKMKDIFTKQDHDTVRAIIIAGFEANEIDLSDDARAKHEANGFVTYTNGLIKNWVKKNPDFNSGEKYEPINKGSRAGQGDETVRALRQVLKTVTDPEVRAEVEQALTDRLAEIKPSTAVVINTEALPEHLRHLVK